jgi:thioredoxin
MRLLLPVALSISMLSFQVTAQEALKSATPELEAAAFDRKLQADPVPILLDVRTAEEFDKGHIEGARNIDWYDSTFTDQISQLERDREVLVYCLSGRRSAAAAEKLRGLGFTGVYNLKGGILQWRAAGLPETGVRADSPGMTKTAFDQTVAGDKLVLVDFYAEWCQPCKKMKPYLEEIAAEMSSTVTVVRIDADANRQLCKDLAIAGLPVLQLYRQGKMLWNHTGFLEKSEVVSELQRH